MVVSAASWVPNISFPWKQVWIGQWPLQIRHTNKKMTGRLHVHMKISGSYSSDSINLKHNAKIARRQMLLATTGITTAFSVVDFSIARPYPSMEEAIVPRYYKTASGVKIEDIVEGEGPIAHEGDVVELNYVCRRSNGYFVYSTADQISGESKPVMLPIDDKQIIAGLKEVLIGMRAGGKRRALIPPYVGYTTENLEPQPLEFGPRRSLLSHVKEPLVFEVQVLKVL